MDIQPLAGALGAEIRGVNLTRLDEAGWQKVHAAFLEYSVLAIRDQKLDAPQFLEAMKIFGEIFHQHNPRFAVPECPAIHYISNQDKTEDGAVYIPGESASYAARVLAKSVSPPCAGVSTA